MKIIKVCPKCGKVDVDDKHIKECKEDFTERFAQQDSYWK